MEPKMLAALDGRGVILDAPETVEVALDVLPGRIAPGARICPGCRISGASTSIGPGSVIGGEGPATLQDCQLGHGVRLKGGSFSGATFLDDTEVGPGAHVRPGCLLEEQAGAAHSVGLKQTILMPYVVMGSLINFCDCLMAGGTSRSNHSEVGSGYVHFNFTPHQDKATPSLMGDVPQGVFLDRAPIFLGGQGGLVGPLRIAYGTILAAGMICRRDVPEPGRLLFGQPRHGAGSIPYEPGHYGQIGRILRNNMVYIGNLRALDAWYRHVRTPFMVRDPWHAACHEGVLQRLREGTAERVRRLKQLADKMQRSLEFARTRHGETLPDSPYGLQQALHERRDALADALACEDGGAHPPPETLVKAVEQAETGKYLEFVHALPNETKRAATAWLQSIVDTTVQRGKTVLRWRVNVVHVS
jgi:hypothetical protein